MLALLLARQRAFRGLLAAALAAIAAIGVAGVIGLLFYVPRPFVLEHFIPLIQHPADSSFPSDHLAALGALCGATWIAARRASVITALIATVVAFARVYVGVHWVSDVVGGFAIGFAIGVAIWYATAAADPLITRMDQAVRRWRVP